MTPVEEPDAGAAPSPRSAVGSAGGARPVAPFTRLAHTHALMIAGDTLIALALAGSLFFSVSPDAARGQVALYLLLTMAPFAFVAPLVGPAIDRRRGGRRAMVTISALGRAGLCIFMADTLTSLLLFPQAFAVLVLGKGYSVAKSALVPALVRDERELVEANSKLVLISSITGFAVAGPGALILQLAGAPWVLLVAAGFFVAASLSSLKIPRVVVAPEPPDPVERAELRSAGILLAASAMAVLRGTVGFFTFLVAFSLRGGAAPIWWYGVVLGAFGVGAFCGAAVAPRLRRLVREEHLLMGALATVALLAVAWWQVGGRLSAVLLGATVGAAASAGKLSFDAVVQRDAPDANQGRSFARFETRFQLSWVIGAFIPVIVTIPLWVGFIAIAAVTGAAFVSYLTGLAAAHRHPVAHMERRRQSRLARAQARAGERVKRVAADRARRLRELWHHEEHVPPRARRAPEERTPPEG